jgi:hypothetical protein
MNWDKLDGLEVIECEKGELQDLVEEEYGTDANQEYYRCVCPRCKERNIKKGELNYDHRNLSVNKDFTYGRCFRCEGVFKDKLHEFTQDLDTKLEDLEKVTQKSFTLDRIDTKLYDLYQNLSESEEGREYIIKRNRYYDPVYNFCSMKFKSPKLLIPYFDLSGKCFYYQFRYTDISLSPSGAKYFNPPIDNKPIYIVPSLSKKMIWDNKGVTILVEGALTAVALKLVVGDRVNVVALMGKVPTSYQIQYLNTIGLYGRVYVMMDETSLSMVVKSRLGAEGIKTEIIPTNGQDAEEMLMCLGMPEMKSVIMSAIEKKPELNFDEIGKRSSADLSMFTMPLNYSLAI